MAKRFFPVLFILALIIGCNSHKDKEIFDSAEKNFNSKNYIKAIAEYEQVINEYASSDYAEKSLLKVGSMYQMLLVPNISRETSNTKAVQFYKKLFVDFPKSPDAPRAIFMAGFILANDLNKFEEAKSAYKTFLEKFPNDPLTPQVKVELENVGKTPEEILEQKIASRKENIK